MEALQKALAIDENFAEAHYLMGLCQRDAQRPAEAVASLLQGDRARTRHYRAREELADLYGRLGRTDEWITQLDALRALDPGPARDVTLGLAYSQGRTGGSRRDDASPGRRALSQIPAHLRRARQGVAGVGAGPRRIAST